MKIMPRFRQPRASATVIAAALALAVGVGVGWQLRSQAANADESAATLAETEIDRFLEALSGNGALDDVLGDAFQLIRSDGRRYDRAAYLAGASSLTGYAVDDVEAVEADGILTATFLVSAVGEIGGVERDTVGQPRLAVFSKVNGSWKLQAYANLGQGLAAGIGDEAKAAVETWVDAVVSGDADAVADILAPEFQLVRSNGAAYDAAAYLARGIPRIDAGFKRRPLSGSVHRCPCAFVFRNGTGSQSLVGQREQEP